MAAQCYDHYTFTLDKAYLREKAWPLMKGAAEFMISTQLKERADGTVVVRNGWSPEHGPREDGVAHDQQIVRELFRDILAAAKSPLMRSKSPAHRLKVDLTGAKDIELFVCHALDGNSSDHADWGVPSQSLTRMLRKAEGGGSPASDETEQELPRPDAVKRPNRETADCTCYRARYFAIMFA